MLTIEFSLSLLRKATGFQQHHNCYQSLVVWIELDAAAGLEQQPHFDRGQGRMGVLPADVGAVSGKAIKVALHTSFFSLFPPPSSSHLHVLALKSNRDEDCG